MNENNKYNWQGKVALIAEDVLSNFTYLHAVLLKTKLRILHAKDGLEAVEMCQKHDIDCVLMDIKMPVMNGYEATCIIKKEKAVPVIAQTAYAMVGDRERILSLGFDDYLSKPIAPETLLNTISRHLG